MNQQATINIMGLLPATEARKCCPVRHDDSAPYEGRCRQQKNVSKLSFIGEGIARFPGSSGVKSANLMFSKRRHFLRRW